MILVILIASLFLQKKTPDVQKFEYLSDNIFINKDGVLHNEHGPAVIYASGKKLYFLNGNNLTKEEWFDSLTDEQKVIALMHMHTW